MAYFAEAAGCVAMNCASIEDALEYIRAWVWEEVETSGAWHSPHNGEERIAVVGAGISLPPAQEEKAAAYQEEAARCKGMRVGWISRKEVA